MYALSHPRLAPSVISVHTYGAVSQSSVAGDKTTPAPATQPGEVVANSDVGDSGGGFHEPSVYALHDYRPDLVKYSLTGANQSTVGVCSTGNTGGCRSTTFTFNVTPYF